MTTANAGEYVEKLDHSYIANRTFKMIQPLWERVWQILIKLNVQFPYDPAIAFLDIYPRQMKLIFTQQPVYECSQKLYL